MKHEEVLIRDMRYFLERDNPFQLTLGVDAVTSLLAHIDAQAARIAELQAECGRLDRESQALSNQLGDCDRRRLAVQSELTALRGSAAPVAVPPGLHPDTADLVNRFAIALAEKLYAAQVKYGYDANWKKGDWKSQCLEHFNQHIAKGDPRDVAAYCAFMWHHGWETSCASGDLIDQLEAARQRIAVLEDKEFRSSEIKKIMRERFEAAEAELARRDAAAGEPIAWINEDELPENYPYDDMYPYSKVDIVRLFPVFGPNTAAQLSALPPEVTHADGPCVVVNGQLNNAWATGANWMREKVKELGCKPFVVKRPNLPDDCDRTEAHYKYCEAIKAAGGSVSDVN